MEEIDYIPNGSLSSYVGNRTKATTNYIMFSYIFKEFKKDIENNKQLLSKVFSKNESSILLSNTLFIDYIYKLLDKMTDLKLLQTYNLFLANKKEEAYQNLKYPQTKKKQQKEKK